MPLLSFSHESKLCDYIASHTQATVALVPTMGNLHQGHLRLVEAAIRQVAQANRKNIVIVSLFVNPLQFAPHEDFATYPRTLAADAALLETLNAQNVELLLFTPAPTFAPQSFALTAKCFDHILCSKQRPHFFHGVATIVLKLFVALKPHYAFFGEKDYQQLQIITALAHDFSLQTEIVPVPTVREPNGLACSSRNNYLSSAEKETAAALYQALQILADNYCSDAEESLQHARDYILSHGLSIDYLEVRTQNTLLPPQTTDTQLIALVAARLNGVRLIDNYTFACNPR